MDEPCPTSHPIPKPLFQTFRPDILAKYFTEPSEIIQTNDQKYILTNQNSFVMDKTISY